MKKCDCRWGSEPCPHVDWDTRIQDAKTARKNWQEMWPELEMTNWYKIGLAKYHMREVSEAEFLRNEPKCDCGTAAVNGPTHSHWCQTLVGHK